MSPRQQRAPVRRLTAAVALPQLRCSRLQPAWPMLPTIRPTRSRATASSTSAASPPSSMAAPTWPARCTSTSASRRSRRIRIRSSWCTAAPASGTNFTGTPDGREGWAQYFVRQGYAVYVVDQPGRGRSGYLAELYGPLRSPDADSGQRRYLSQEKYKLWPQAHLHTQWPGTGEPDDAGTLQMTSRLPAGDRGFHQAAVPQPRCTGGADRQDRPVRS